MAYSTLHSCIKTFLLRFCESLKIFRCPPQNCTMALPKPGRNVFTPLCTTYSRETASGVWTCHHKIRLETFPSLLSPLESCRRKEFRTALPPPPPAFSPSVCLSPLPLSVRFPLRGIYLGHCKHHMTSRGESRARLTFSLILLIARRMRILESESRKVATDLSDADLIFNRRSGWSGPKGSRWSGLARCSGA